MTTATKAQRTPGPWKRNRVDSIVGAGGVEVCNMSLYGYHLPPFANANAEHILAACNAHDANVARIAELERALRDCVEVAKAWHAADDVWQIYYDHSPEMATTRAALAKGQA